MTTPTPEQLAQWREDADTQAQPEPAVSQARRLALEQALDCCNSTAPFPESKYHIADKIKELLKACPVYTNPPAPKQIRGMAKPNELIELANKLATKTWVNGEGSGGEVSEAFTKISRHLVDLEKDAEKE